MRRSLFTATWIIIAFAAGMGTYHFFFESVAPGPTSTLSNAPIAAAKSTQVPDQAPDLEPRKSETSPQPDPPYTEQESPRIPPRFDADNRSSSEIADASAGPVEAPGPWQAALDRPPVSADEIAFTAFDIGKSLPQREDLEHWFDSVTANTIRMANVRGRPGQCAAFDGVLKLRAPWHDDCVLRLELDDYGPFQIHCYHGERGLAINFHNDDGPRLAAYAMTRQSGSVTPRTLCLTATDDSRARRTELRQGGPFELRQANGELILSRGDIALLAAPLPGPPDEVLIVGRASFHGIDLVRVAGNSVSEAERVQAPWRDINHGEWIGQVVDGAEVRRGDRNRLALHSDRATIRSAMSFPLGEPGLNEWLVELENVSPGAGIYFSRENARPVQVLRFVKDRTSGGLCLMLRGDDDVSEHQFPTMQERPIPLSSQRVWLRFAFAFGGIRWWMSSDGEHWADPDEPLVNPPGGPTHLSVQTIAQSAQCQIAVNRLACRPIVDVDALGIDRLLNRVPVPFELSSPASWTIQTLESQPADVDANDWRMACLVKTLQRCPAPELGWHLLQLLVESPQFAHLSMQERLPILGRMASLFNFREQPNFQTAFVQYIQNAGRQHGDSENPFPFSSTRRMLMTVPLCPKHAAVIMSPGLARREILQLVYSGRWTELDRLCQVLRFFHWNRQVPLHDWASSYAVRNLPAEKRPVSPVKIAWRHPLIEDVRKEVYNFGVDLESLLRSGSLGEAAELISQSDPRSNPGVSSLDDEDYFASITTQIRRAFARFPKLGDAVAGKLSELAELRLRQSTTAADESAVELVPLQFPGTRAAQQAHRWLADQQLVQGRFRPALRHYQQISNEPEQSEVGWRFHLAEAGAGVPRHAENTAFRETIEHKLGKLSRSEFERILADLNSQSGSAPEVLGPLSSGSLVPSSFRLTTGRGLGGHLGESPDQEGAQHSAHLKVPWAQRQLACVRAGSVLYVCNRFQVTAFALGSTTEGATGGDSSSEPRLLWQSARPIEKMLRAQDWPLVPMVPLVLSDRIIVRQLYGSGPMLVCLDRASGQIVWTAEQRTNEECVSDPMWVRDQLIAITVLRTEQHEGELRLTTFDPATGYVVGHRPLLRVRETWWQRRYLGAHFDSYHERIFLAVGGAVLSCDANGNIDWLRRSPILPVDEEPNWVSQAFQPPQLLNDCLIVFQPGSRALDCLDAETGITRWRTVVTDIRRLVIASPKMLVCETDEGWVGVSTATGSVQWKRRQAGILDGISGGSDNWLAVRRDSIDNSHSQFVVRLEWCDLETGSPRATTTLESLSGRDPQLGPLVTLGDHLFAFIGRNLNDPQFELVELIRNGNAEPVRPTSLPPTWLRHVPDRLQEATNQMLPDWKFLQGDGSGTSAPRSEVDAESDVLGIRLRSWMPIVFGRQISFAEGTTPKLAIRIGNEPIQAWRLEVRWNGRVIWRQEIQEASHPQRWKEFEVDLKELAGMTGWLTVRGQLIVGGDGSLVYWKRLDIGPSK